MVCPVCNKRKGKRFCPAKAAKICTTCCASEREVTIDCPFECPHLKESRPREYKGLLDADHFPYKEIRISDSFLRDHEELLLFCGSSVLGASLETPKATDRDTREALDALIQTYKTLGSGIYYETRPESAYARAIVDRIKELLREFEEAETQRTALHRSRDTELLHVLVFLYRMAIDRNNGRVRGKAFLDFLRLHFQPAEEKPAAAPSLIIPGA